MTSRKGSVEQRVRREWPLRWVEAWYDKSGGYMNDGCSQAVADQRAFLLLRDEVGKALNGEG